MVACQLPKLIARVRFPLPAPDNFAARSVPALRFRRAILAVPSLTADEKRRRRSTASSRLDYAGWGQASASAAPAISPVVGAVAFGAVVTVVFEIILILVEVILA